MKTETLLRRPVLFFLGALIGAWGCGDGYDPGVLVGDESNGIEGRLVFRPGNEDVAVGSRHVLLFSDGQVFETESEGFLSSGVDRGPQPLVAVPDADGEGCRVLERPRGEFRERFAGVALTFDEPGRGVVRIVAERRDGNRRRDAFALQGTPVGTVRLRCSGALPADCRPARPVFPMATLVAETEILDGDGRALAGGPYVTFSGPVTPSRGNRAVPEDNDPWVGVTDGPGDVRVALEIGDWQREIDVRVVDEADVVDVRLAFEDSEGALVDAPRPLPCTMQSSDSVACEPWPEGRLVVAMSLADGTTTLGAAGRLASLDPDVLLVDPAEIGAGPERSLALVDFELFPRSFGLARLELTVAGRRYEHAVDVRPPAE